MKKLFDSFVSNDTLCVSITKNRYSENDIANFSSAADRTDEVEFPCTFNGTFKESSEKSSVFVFTFRLSKWFEEFEYVDSFEKCENFLKRMARTGRNPRQWTDYNVRELSKFKRYDWSRPLAFMVSDRLLVCDIIRFFDGQFCRLDPIGENGYNSYGTQTLHYLLKEAIMCNRRENTVLRDKDDPRSDFVSPIHSMGFHYELFKSVNEGDRGMIGYSVRSVAKMMLLHEFSRFRNAISVAKDEMAKAEGMMKSLENGLPELELRLSARGF